MARDDDVLAVAAGTGEPELVVVLAQLRVAGLAAPAAVARDHPLADDACAGSEPGDAVACLLDRAAPLVPRHEREGHPARIGQAAVENLEVGAADAGDVAADEHVARAWRRPVQLAKSDLVRPLDHDRLHALAPRLR